MAKHSFVKMFSDRFVLSTLLALFIGFALGSWIAHQQSSNDVSAWLDSFLQNAGTEMLGAFLTFLLIEILVTQRRGMESIEHRRRELITRMNSRNNVEALRAVENLRIAGWLTDGSLEGAQLSKANLQGADLVDADLRGANLIAADLRGANLFNANLLGANLALANLERAILVETDIRKADLRDANLEAANLDETQFALPTILPDGSKWTPDTNIRQFTHRNHPAFWRSKFALSPAFEKK